MSTTETENIQTEHVHRQTSTQFVLFTVIAAGVASLAAWSSAALMLEVWMMFSGFIAWFTRPASRRDGLAAMLCLWLGIGLGAAAHMATTALAPSIDALVLPLVVLAGPSHFSISSTPTPTDDDAFSLRAERHDGTP